MIEMEAGLRVVYAHESGDGVQICHCPFCGSGQVVGRSDGNTECGFCNSAFIVRVQPMMSAFPQSIDGAPVQIPGMPPPAPGAPGQGMPPGADGEMGDDGQMPFGGDEEGAGADGSGAPPFGDQDGADGSGGGDSGGGFPPKDSGGGKDDSEKDDGPPKKESARLYGGGMDRAAYLAHLADLVR